MARKGRNELDLIDPRFPTKAGRVLLADVRSGAGGPEFHQHVALEISFAKPALAELGAGPAALAGRPGAGRVGVGPVGGMFHLRHLDEKVRMGC